MSLVEEIAGPGGDLLGLSRWLGVEIQGKRRHEAARELQVRLQSIQAIRDSLERRRADGYPTVVSLGDRRLFEALGRRPRESMPMVVPIVPNLQGFMREAVEYGMVGAGLRRAWRVGPLAMAGLGLRGMGRAPALLKRDFPTMVRCFVELELADFTCYGPPVVFLQAQITDLALAMSNPRVIEAYVEAVRGRLGAEPGLMTHNFGTLSAALHAWGIEVASILTPWESEGWRLRPSAESCRQAARSSSIPIWADRQGSMESPGAADRAEMKSAGLEGALRDDLELWSDG